MDRDASCQGILYLFSEHAVVALTAGICVLVFIVLVLAVVTVIYCSMLRRRIKVCI